MGSPKGLRLFGRGCGGWKPSPFLIVSMLDPTSRDTIAAVATAKGEGGVAVVRISGGGAASVLSSVFRRASETAWNSGRMYRGTMVSGEEIIDEGLAALFRGPRSYTGEDVAEIHGHGGYTAPDRVLRACLDAGARLALPGEFTFRAFINGKLDLMQAEAVADLIESSTPADAALSAKALLGELSGRFTAIQDALLGLLARIEACADFPEEDIEEVTASHALSVLEPMVTELETSIGDASHLRLLREGVRVCLTGSPNAGKSSLFNALLKENRALISEYAGTTRDALEERLRIGDMDIVLTDTAGLRDSAHPIERMGVERAYEALNAADVALCVIDCSKPLSAEDRAALDATGGMRRVVALSKADLGCLVDITGAVRVSAVTGAGLDTLRDTLANLCAEARGNASPAFLRQRQVDAAAAALTALIAAGDALRSMPLDCAAIDLKDAYRALGAITGRGADEDVVQAIFSTFCLGK